MVSVAEKVSPRFTGEAMLVKGTRMESARAEYDGKLSQEREEVIKGQEMELPEEVQVGAVSVQILTKNFTQAEALPSPGFMLQLWSIAYSFPVETA